MKTELTRSHEVAARYIREGGIVAFPTETVYGLGADIFDERAIDKIFEAKRRPADNPLIAHIGTIDQITELTAQIPVTAQKLIERFFPGPLTLVLKKTERVPLIATAGLETIGVRMPAHRTATEFLRACGRPVVAPSANISGRPSPTTWQSVRDDLDGRIECILQGEPTVIGLESTVVDCTVDPPVVLRAGAVSLEALREQIGDISAAVAGQMKEARSPGLRHKHYSPSADVVLGVGPASGGTGAFIGVTEPAWQPDLLRVCESVDQYAREVFEFFRECDRQKIQTIVCEPVEETGIGAALMDRLRRAERG